MDIIVYYNCLFTNGDHVYADCLLIHIFYKSITHAYINNYVYRRSCESIDNTACLEGCRW